MTTNGKPKFSLGQILATPGALGCVAGKRPNIQSFLVPCEGRLGRSVRR